MDFEVCGAVFQARDGRRQFTTRHLHMQDKGMWKTLCVEGKNTTMRLEPKDGIKSGKRWEQNGRLKLGHKWPWRSCKEF